MNADFDWSVVGAVGVLPEVGTNRRRPIFGGALPVCEDCGNHGW